MSETLDPRDEFSPAEFVRRAAWQEAIQPFAGAAHEYAVRGRGLPAELHDAMLAYIAEHGYDGSFKGRPYRYVDVGGFTLWASRPVFPPFTYLLLNRRPIEAA
jgi:hypothetical protein